MPNTPRYTETQFKQKVFRVLNQHFPHIYIRKLSDRFHAGVLDCFVCYMGRSTWLELKVYPNKLTPLQSQEILNIQSAGGTSYCLTAYPDTGAYTLNNIIDVRQGNDLLTLLKEVL